VHGFRERRCGESTFPELVGLNRKLRTSSGVWRSWLYLARDQLTHGSRPALVFGELSRLTEHETRNQRLSLLALAPKLRPCRHRHERGAAAIARAWFVVGKPLGLEHQQSVWGGCVERERPGHGSGLHQVVTCRH